MCARLVMRGAFRQFPLTDRHIQLPFRPLLYSTPPTSVTLTVKAHLSIRCSNCSLGWLSFQRRPGCPPPPSPPLPSLSRNPPHPPRTYPGEEPSVLCVKHASGRFGNLRESERMRGDSESYVREREISENTREIWSTKSPRQGFFFFFFFFAAALRHRGVRSCLLSIL